MVPAKKRSRFESAACSRRISASGALSLRADVEPCFERQMETAPQLGGRLTREGDGRHVLDLVHAFGNTGSHARGQHLRLAGAGARLDQDVGEQLLANGATRLLVCDFANQAWFASLLNASPFASASLMSAWAFARPSHAATKSQYVQSFSFPVLVK